MGLHRCTEAECCYTGQPSPRECGCHQSDEAVLREAIQPFADACTVSTFADDEDIGDSLAATRITWGDLRRAHRVCAAIARATGQSVK